MSIQPTTVPAQVPDAARGGNLWGADGFGFDDLVDVVNPLQHLPVVSTIYRQSTGDEIGLIPRLMGGLLFGGMPGLASATVNGGVAAGTGRDLGEHAMALLFGAEPSPTLDPSAAEHAAAARAYADAGPPAPHAAVPFDQAPPVVVPPDPLPRLAGARERLLAEVEVSAGFTGNHDLVV